MVKKVVRKKAYVDEHYCVACGYCSKICPMNAINIEKGIVAKVNLEKCVGCGKCLVVCPASTIEILAINGGDN